MVDEIADAVTNFYKPDNIRNFVLGIMNGTVTPFIECLSDYNNRTPEDNASELSNLANSYIADSYRTLKYFGAKEGNTLHEYVHSNDKPVRRTANYIFVELENKLPPNQFYQLIIVLLSFYSVQNTKADGNSIVT